MARQSGWDEDIPAMDIPYYGRLSHPISPIPAQRSVTGTTPVSPLGTALSGAGDVIEGAAKFADDLYKTGMHQIAETEFTPKVRAEVQRVADLRNQVYGARSDASAVPQGGTSGSVTGGPATGAGGWEDSAAAWAAARKPTEGPTELPPGMRAGIQAIKDREQFRASGHVSQTQFKGEIDKISSDYRSQFPVMYRPLWDRTVAEITGIPHTANEYMQSNIQDINDLTATRKAEHAKIESRLIEAAQKYGQPIINAWKKYNQDGDPYSAIAEISKYESAEHDVTTATARLHLQELERAQREGARTSNVEEGKDQLNQYTSRTVNNVLTSALDDFRAKHGLPDPSKDPDGFRRALDNLRPDQATELGTTLGSVQTTAAKIITDYANKPLGDPANPAMSLFSKYNLQQSDITNMVTAASAPLDNWRKALADKDFGPVSADARWTKQQEDRDVRQLLEYPSDTAAHMRAVAAVRRVVGSEALGPVLTSLQLTNLASDLDKYAGLLEQQRLNSIALPNRNIRVDAEDVQRKAEADGKTPDQIGTLMDTFADRPREFFTNPTIKQNPELEKRFVNYVYGPKSAGMIGSFSARNGEYYAKFYDPEVTKEIYRLDGKAWDTYLDRAESTFASEIAVPIVRSLNRMAEDPTIKVNFDDLTNSFNYDMGGIQNVMSRRESSAHPYDAYLKDLNTAIQSVKPIAELTGQEPKQYLFSVFHGLGVTDKAAQMLATAIQSTENKPKIAPRTP